MSTALEHAIDEALTRGEVGLQVAAYLGGELVLDVSAGDAGAGTTPVGSGTVFWVASAGKVSTAAALHLQVERGLLDFDQTVASVWPEFGAAGKERFTVRDALTHRVGLAEMPSDVTPELLGDWEWMADRLARSAPAEDLETRNSYHPRTWGNFVGEIVRRSDPEHRSFEDFVRQEVHEPLGVTEVWHRLPASVHGRVALMQGDILSTPDGEPLYTVTADDEINTPTYMDCIDPSGGWMTARSGARLWSLYAQGGQVDGTRFLSEELVHSLLQPRAGGFGAGPMTSPRTLIGQGELMLGSRVPEHERVLGFRDDVLWHPGAGGALGFADLRTGLSGLIAHNQFFDDRFLPEHPFAPIVRAIYTDVLG